MLLFPNTSHIDIVEVEGRFKLHADRVCIMLANGSELDGKLVSIGYMAYLKVGATYYLPTSTRMII